MNKGELITNIAEKAGTSKAEAEKFLEVLSETIAEMKKESDRDRVLTLIKDIMREYEVDIKNRECPTCHSKGFPTSKLGSDRCEFCDGTEGGAFEDDFKK